MRCIEQFLHIKMIQSKFNHCIVKTQHRSYSEKAIFGLLKVKNINICNKNCPMGKDLETVRGNEIYLKRLNNIVMHSQSQN